MGEEPKQSLGPHSHTSFPSLPVCFLSTLPPSLHSSLSFPHSLTFTPYCLGTTWNVSCLGCVSGTEHKIPGFLSSGLSSSGNEGHKTNNKCWKCHEIKNGAPGKASSGSDIILTPRPTGGARIRPCFGWRHWQVQGSWGRRGPGMSQCLEEAGQ